MWQSIAAVVLIVGLGSLPYLAVTRRDPCADPRSLESGRAPTSYLAASSSKPTRPSLPPPLDGFAPHSSWPKLLAELRRPEARRVLIVDARYGLANRLLTIASAMSVAAALGRPLVIAWEVDVHCNCSFRALFSESGSTGAYPFTLVEGVPPLDRLTGPTFRTYNYMSAEGGRKDEPVDEADARHIYFRGASAMKHPEGGWRDAAWYLQHALVPVPDVAARVITLKWMVGLHVAEPFAEPPIVASRNGSSIEPGVAGAEPGVVEGGRYHHYVVRTRALLERRSTRVYLAPDDESIDAGGGLRGHFAPGVVLRSPRRHAERPEREGDETEGGAGGDARGDRGGCERVQSVLVDLINLAKTGTILGSKRRPLTAEVASHIGAREVRGSDDDRGRCVCMHVYRRMRMRTSARGEYAAAATTEGGGTSRCAYAYAIAYMPHVRWRRSPSSLEGPPPPWYTAHAQVPYACMHVCMHMCRYEPTMEAVPVELGGPTTTSPWQLINMPRQRSEQRSEQRSDQRSGQSSDHPSARLGVSHGVGRQRAKASGYRIQEASGYRVQEARGWHRGVPWDVRPTVVQPIVQRWLSVGP